MRAGNVIGLTPDGTNLGCFAAIHADALVEDDTTHCIALHIVEVAINHGSHLLTLLLGYSLDEVFEHLVEAIVAPVLVGVTCLSDVVAWLVALLAHTLLDFLVVNLVAVFTLGDSKLGSELLLSDAHGLDSIVRKLQRSNQVFFLNLVHLTLYHHNIVVSSTYHQFHVSVFELFEGGVNNEVTINASHTHLADGLLEGDITNSDSSASCKTSKSVGAISTVA